MTRTPRDAADMIRVLDLSPHPEGGHYRQTWAAPLPDGAPVDARPTATAILFLLARGERSHWHRVDADEVWLWHAGAPLTLRIARDTAGPAARHTLGPAVPAEAPQIVVPARAWQAAETTGDWTLVSCTVSPGFRFEGFELAPPGFDIQDA